ncbi:MAG: NAD(P)H-hydrate dehydratase [Salinibacterium sp.]|nr:MAG: NAD(P)H-hydrate dehydratase [Salinibacterium sp.]
MADFTEWTPRDAAANIAVPAPHDDKYSRGVLGVITGSERYPGAAVLGVEAALRTGVGMVRYLGPAADFVLERRPEAVTVDGEVQAWLIGSGMDDSDSDRASAALAQNVPVVLDGGLIPLLSRARGPVVITPHHGELARLLGVERAEISGDPGQWARASADQLGVTVLLKGHTSYIAGPGVSLSTSLAPTWLATAGAGDALAGILGALVATHRVNDSGELARLAATATVIHGLAAERASGGGPFTVLDLAEAIPAAITTILGRDA